MKSKKPNLASASTPETKTASFKTAKIHNVYLQNSQCQNAQFCCIATSSWYMRTKKYYSLIAEKFLDLKLRWIGLSVGGVALLHTGLKVGLMCTIVKLSCSQSLFLYLSWVHGTVLKFSVLSLSFHLINLKKTEKNQNKLLILDIQRNSDFYFLWTYTVKNGVSIRHAKTDTHTCRKNSTRKRVKMTRLRVKFARLRVDF
jgi:hypothetical protein